jgi:3-hydroxyisobutyrate dehydrogenase-like beta-hydroxyacid dehydrogenase
MAVAVVSPGAMGSALGAALAPQTVLTTLDGRSARTRELAARASFVLLPDLAELVAASDVVLSVVPPGEAVATAGAIASAAKGANRRPLVVDLNATSPLTLNGVAAALREAGLDVVDGSISGPPPWHSDTTRIYLSGPRAQEVAALGFRGVDVRVIGRELGTASALKMSTASIYKGVALLLTHALVTARAYGTLPEVIGDLERTFPELLQAPEVRLASAASKSQRYIAEMREIAQTQESAGLPAAVFEAIATAYEAIASSPAAQSTPEQAARSASLEDVLAAIAPASNSARRTPPESPRAPFVRQVHNRVYPRARPPEDT